MQLSIRDLRKDYISTIMKTNNLSCVIQEIKFEKNFYRKTPKFHYIISAHQAQ
jgi:hypothetical protein